MLNVAQPIEWTGKGVVMLDQRRLPGEVIRHTYTDYRDVAAAIKDMVIRGAPAIGVAAAMGVALGVERSNARTLDELRAEFPGICRTIAQTRPTAVDLFWAVERMTRRFEQLAAAKMQPDALRRAMVEEARAIHAEKRATDEAMGRYGADLMPAAGQVMTHCNAGALATAGIGSAPGVIRMAVERGHKLHEGAVPLTLITDNMVGHFMKTGSVGAVVVGADRIAANGDTANKIGTYQIAVLAREHGVPFYVAAPVSTFDLNISSGEQIPIEERAAEEVTHLCGVRIAPDVAVANPAFDVTPARLISAIICERGVARAPYAESLRRLAVIAAPRAGSAV